jgi:hypothetical protein
MPGLKSAVAKPDAAAALARRFCHALAVETAGRARHTGSVANVLVERLATAWVSLSRQFAGL